MDINHSNGGITVITSPVVLAHKGLVITVMPSEESPMLLAVLAARREPFEKLRQPSPVVLAHKGLVITVMPSEESPMLLAVLAARREPFEKPSVKRR